MTQNADFSAGVCNTLSFLYFCAFFFNFFKTKKQRSPGKLLNKGRKAINKRERKESSIIFRVNPVFSESIPSPL